MVHCLTRETSGVGEASDARYCGCRMNFACWEACCRARSDLPPMLLMYNAQVWNWMNPEACMMACTRASDTSDAHPSAVCLPQQRSSTLSTSEITEIHLVDLQLTRH